MYQAVLFASESGVAWFPPAWADTFYVAKGIIALLGTLMLLAHMSREWSEAMTTGRRLRYLALLVYAVVSTGASVEQAHQEAIVNYRNLGGMVAAVVLVIAMAVSIHESRRKP